MSFEKSILFFLRKRQFSFVLRNLTIPVAFYGKCALICWKKLFLFRNAIGKHRVKNVPFEKNSFLPYFINIWENNNSRRTTQCRNHRISWMVLLWLLKLITTMRRWKQSRAKMRKHENFRVLKNWSKKPRSDLGGIWGIWTFSIFVMLRCSIIWASIPFMNYSLNDILLCWINRVIAFKFVNRSQLKNVSPSIETDRE